MCQNLAVHPTAQALLRGQDLESMPSADLDESSTCSIVRSVSRHLHSGQARRQDKEIRR